LDDDAFLFDPSDDNRPIPSVSPAKSVLGTTLV
jgi:hypothetical protein